MLIKKISISLLGLMSFTILSSWTTYSVETRRYYEPQPVANYYSSAPVAYYQHPYAYYPTPIAVIPNHYASNQRVDPRNQIIEMLPREEMGTHYESKDARKQRKKEEKNERKAEKKATYKTAYQNQQTNQLHQNADRDGFIWFSGQDNMNTFFLSNFYTCQVNIWNQRFRCAQSALEAAKFLDYPHAVKRLTKADGETALKLAQDHSYKQRKDWYQVREALMLEVLRAKFQQNPDLQNLLLATGDAYLVEHTDRDAFWADGGDGKGKNRLGHLLMQVRGELGGVGVVEKPAKYRKFVR